MQIGGAVEAGGSRALTPHAGPGPSVCVWTSVFYSTGFEVCRGLAIPMFTNIFSQSCAKSSYTLLFQAPSFLRSLLACWAGSFCIVGGCPCI